MTLFWPAFLTLIAVQCALAITCAPWLDLIDGPAHDTITGEG